MSPGILCFGIMPLVGLGRLHCFFLVFPLFPLLIFSFFALCFFTRTWVPKTGSLSTSNTRSPLCCSSCMARSMPCSLSTTAGRLFPNLQGWLSWLSPALAAWPAALLVALPSLSADLEIVLPPRRANSSSPGSSARSSACNSAWSQPQDWNFGSHKMAEMVPYPQPLLSVAHRMERTLQHSSQVQLATPAEAPWVP